ncbi:hypothetical protein PHLGIDRAFT_18672 [Phlebiopsis gigantea 11061_1 CR5-6]|uniref:Uncharacterized protein n=1 Tax=Phlebiopsis gigantea (strain 11061_1 CR5-6) TaxID=745531 RepID=A0A0C3PQC1_PHLG1|nr:hypothetical protein PHLGIDRAFT_18672 [Phlebiopsis gigantea 11061_1 CR5-6]
MSNTTILEMPDAQMLDYSVDSDFTMHATGHHPEWLSVEATMSDDSIFHREYSETVEIEMEQNDEDEITEYEMADGEESYGQDVSVELEDVDFADPSSMTSPQHISTINSPLVVDVASPQPVSAEALLLLPPAVHSDLLPSPHDGPGPSDVYPVHSTEVPPADAFTSAPLTTVSSREPLPSSISLLSEPDHIHRESLTHVEDGLAWSSTPVTTTSTTAEQSEIQPPLPEGNEPGVEITSDGIEGNQVSQPGLTHVEDSPAAVSDRYADNAEESVAQDASAEPTEEQPQDESSGSDPHEISDGVYIDPPPAVLLSIVSSSERVDYCLFNQPQPRSGSQSPNAYASSSTTADLVLLLSQRPTLYYEPLNSVFEAFHQEETIANISELADGELVLEAPDLNLRILEENIHTAEVTLHELNVLHDGIDLAGPLRLQLSAVPRFITRYHALREQVAQLTLIAGLGDEPHAHEAIGLEHVPLESELSIAQSDDPSGASAAANENGVQEATEVLDEGSAEAPPSEVLDGEYTVDASSSQEQQVHSDPLPNVEETEKHDEHRAEDEAESAPVKYDTEHPIEEAVESLDADEGQQIPDAGEGGDYTEYPDEPQDDDDDFGEPLPEELSDREEASNLQHDIPQDIHEDAFGEVNEADAGEEDSAVPNASDVELCSSHPEDSSGLADGVDPQEPAEYPEATDEALDEPVPDVSVNEPDVDPEEFGNFEDFEDETDTQAHQDVSLDGETEEWGEYDDDDADDENTLEAPAHVEGTSPLSNQSSETLSTLSKRSRDEGEEDDEHAIIGNPPGSPDNKRLRVQ